MLSEKEIKFLEYWSENRLKLSKPISKLIGGLSFAILFVLPIILLFFIVYFFNPEWYAKIVPTHSGTFNVIIVSLIIAIFFISYFRMQYIWETNEQAYQELVQKQGNNKAANINII